MRAVPAALTVAYAGALVALLATPAGAAPHDGGDDLVVTSDGVSFDASRLTDSDGWVGYAVTSLDGSGVRYLGDLYTAADTADGFLSFDQAQAAYSDGYCVTWVHMTGTRDQFASWNGDSPACTTAEATPAPTPTKKPAPPSSAGSAANGSAGKGTPRGDGSATGKSTEDETTPDDEAGSGAPTGTQEPDATPPLDQPAAEPSVDDDTAAPDEPSPTPEPTQTPETTAPTSGTETTTAQERILGSIERGAPPAPAGGFPTLAVAGLGGLAAAAAGGAILLLRRAR